MTYNPFLTKKEHDVALNYIVLARDHTDAQAILKFIIEHYEHAHTSAQIGQTA